MSYNTHFPSAPFAPFAPPIEAFNSSPVYTDSMVSNTLQIPMGPEESSAVPPLCDLYYRGFRGRRAPLFKDYDDWFGFHREKGAPRMPDYRDTKFFKHADRWIRYNYMDLCSATLFRLPPLLFAMPPFNGQEITPETPVLTKDAGTKLKKLIEAHVQPLWSEISAYFFIMYSDVPVMFLRSFCRAWPQDHNPFFEMAVDLYTFDRQNYYASTEYSEDPLIWLKFCDRFNTEVLEPVLTIFKQCRMYDHLKVCKFDSNCVQDIGSGSVKFDMVIEHLGELILPVVCLNNLWSSPTHDKKSSPLLNKKKLQAARRFLLSGRCMSVLVTDFQSAALLQLDPRALHTWEVTEENVAEIPLAVRMFDETDCNVPLRYAVMAAIYMEFTESSVVRMGECRLLRRARVKMTQETKAKKKNEKKQKKGLHKKRL